MFAFRGANRPKAATPNRNPPLNACCKRRHHDHADSEWHARYRRLIAADNPTAASTPAYP